MGVIVYISSVTASMEIKGQQQRIQMILSSKKIEYEEMDIASSEDTKEKMREIAGNPKQLPPVICNDDTFCGDFQAFENAIEDDQLEEFLKLK